MSNTVLVGTIVDPPSKAITIFGREPAALLGLIEAALVALVAFQLGVTTEAAGLISAFVSVAIGAYTAWATRDTLLGVATGLAKAAVALVVYYGVDLTPEQVGAIVTLAPILVGFWQRTQTSPVADPVDPSPQQVVPVDPPAADMPFADDGDGVEVPADGRMYELGDDGTVRPAQ